jgi:hydroxyquinol 1,2-dioxygenase
MRNINEDTITQAVLAAMSGCTNDRLRTVMTSLVQHLHSFARDVKLTESEWLYAINFLTDVGHITDQKRQEFVLLSDTLGLSMLVTTQNNRKPVECTEATVLGPFFVSGAPEYANGDDISNGAAGLPCFVSGSVRGLSGEPVAGAAIEVWQSDEDGFYDVQYGDSFISARFSPRLIPFRTTDRLAECSMRSDAIRGAQPTCTSGSRRQGMSR